MRFLIAAVALLAATPAFATDWALATSADDKSSAIFVDRDSIKKESDGMVRAQTFYALAADKDDGLAAIQLLQEYDCNGRRFRRLHMTAYFADGSTKLDTEYVTEWKVTKAGDQAEAMLEFVCAGGPKSSSVLSIGNQFPLHYARRELLK